jgi:hypothetical protein
VSWRIIVPAVFMLSAVGAPRQTPGEIDTGFQVLLHRNEQPVPVIVAQITTTKFYPCAGYGLRLSVRNEGDTVTLAVTGMVRPSPCLQSMDPATGTAYLFPPGERSVILRILYREQSDFYRCRVTNTGVRVTTLRARFTDVSWDPR